VRGENQGDLRDVYACFFHAKSLIILSIMLATLLELLGGREVESLGSRVAEEEVGAERREELPSEMDEKEFKLLMMQVC
jgi:hypothetical protein